MERIGILGGTFNPVHSEHVNLAKSAIKELSLTRLIVMPTYMSPHKNLKPAPAIDRLNMLKLAFDKVEGVTVSDYEIVKQGKSYTYLTLEHFKSQFNAQLFFIVGGDMLTDFKTWKNPQRILQLCDLCVFDREDFYTDYTAEKEYFINTFGKEFIKLNYVGKPVSSTKIRVYSALNIPLPLILPQQVEDYIKEKDLYGGDKYWNFIKENLTKSRIKHTADVIITALKKAKLLGLDQNKVLLSALLHDCAKYLDYKEFKGFNLPEGVPTPVIHAFLGAYVAQTLLGIDDEEIIDAIKYHTSGKPNMSTLGKLIFVADMVEEGRTYQGVEQLRALYEKEDFEYCFTQCLKEEFIHLINKKQYIYSATLKAYEFYIKE